MRRTVQRLDSKLYRAFRSLAKAGLEQYGLSKADLADQVTRRQSKSDLFYERARVQTRRSGDALAGKTRTQVRRFVENVLSRQSSPEAARVVIWRIVNSKKACAWRKSSADRTDVWLTRVLELSRTGAPYVRECFVVSDDGPVYAFIHPKGVAEFVRQTLEDTTAWLPTRMRASVEKAMIRSIEKHAKDRARAFSHWVALSEAFIDVRVYEGPMYDPVSGATVETFQIRYSRVKPFDARPPLGIREREPKTYERIEAAIADTLDDSGKPTSIVRFVVGPFEAVEVGENEVVVE